MIARYAWVLLGLGLAACDTAEELGGPAPPPDALRFVDLDVGYLHACALTAGGSV